MLVAKSSWPADGQPFEPRPLSALPTTAHPVERNHPGRCAGAACGGLEPPLRGRLRGAYPHRQHGITFGRPIYIGSTFVFVAQLCPPTGVEGFDELFTKTIQGAPPEVAALEAIALGLGAFAGRLQAQGDVAARRIRIVSASPELSERQLIKFASMADRASQALRDRAVSDEAAILAAETVITVFRVAAARWLEDPTNKPLPELVADAFAQLRAVASA